MASKGPWPRLAAEAAKSAAFWRSRAEQHEQRGDQTRAAIARQGQRLFEKEQERWS